MKKFALLSLLAAGALAFTPKPALAGDSELAALGGFLGGLIVGSHLSDRDSYHPSTVVVSHDRRYDRYDRHDRYDDCDRPVRYDRYDRPDRGYWKHVKVRTWVPGYWTTRYDCGRRIRYYVEGYWTYRTDRVWVSHDYYDRGHRRHG